MRKLIVITLALMAFGVYDSRRPHKVAVRTDPKELSEKCSEMALELKKIKAGLDMLEKQAFVSCQVD